MSRFCPTCGTSMNDDDQFCRACGATASATQPTPSVAPTLPAGPSQTSGKAITSLIFGLFIFFFPFSIVAIIFGHLSLSEIRKSAGRLHGDGLAIAGLVLGYMGLAAVPIILIVAAIAIPNLMRARLAANEASAVAAVRTINLAEVNYSGSHPEAGYTCALSNLAADQLIDKGLAIGLKNGYAFELTDCAPAQDGGGNAKYQVVAYPVTVNQTGVRAFCSDETAVIRVDANGSAQNCLRNGPPLR